MSSKIRTFREIALCHLPDAEIGMITSDIHYAAITTAYTNNKVGFFIWTKTDVSNCTVLQSILNQNQDVDYICFDIDVEPDPELEMFDV